MANRMVDYRQGRHALFKKFITDLTYWATQGRTRNVWEAVRCSSTATTIPRRGFALPTQLVLGEKKEGRLVFFPSKPIHLAVVSSYATGIIAASYLWR